MLVTTNQTVAGIHLLKYYKADDTRGNFLSNVAGQLWVILPSADNQVSHRAHDRSKVSR